MSKMDIIKGIAFTTKHEGHILTDCKLERFFNTFCRITFVRVAL